MFEGYLYNSKLIRFVSIFTMIEDSATELWAIGCFLRGGQVPVVGDKDKLKSLGDGNDGKISQVKYTGPKLTFKI